MEKLTSVKENALGSFGGWNFREKIQLVQQDLTVSLKTISQKAKREARTVNKKARKVLAVEDVHHVRDEQVFDGNLDVGFDLYKREPTFVGQYTNWGSFCSTKQEVNLTRAYKICSPTKLPQELDIIHQIFRSSRYPDRVIEWYLPSTKRKLEDPRTFWPMKCPIHICIPWFQKNWTQIHEDSVTNSDLAQVTDDIIFNILKAWQKWDSDVSTLHSNLVALPDILTKVEIANTQIDSLGKQMRKLEYMILEYEDVCQRAEMAARKLKEKDSLGRFIEQKDSTFQKQRAEKRERASSTKEEVERQDSYEKQQAYEDAFLQQMNEYIRLGKVEVPIAGHADHTTDLDDVTIDAADLNTLSEFLGPEEMDSVIKSQAALNRSSDVLSSSSSNSTKEDISVATSDVIDKDGNETESCRKIDKTDNSSELAEDFVNEVNKGADLAETSEKVEDGLETVDDGGM